MRPRVPVPRLLRLRRRTFSLTQGGGGGSRTRPHVPFLALPTRTAPRPRYFTTQRRQWLRYEALAFVRLTAYFWTAVGCVLLGQFVLQQEWHERAHPTPPEWSYLSRMRLRDALSAAGVRFGVADGVPVDEEDEGIGGDETAGRRVSTRIVDHAKVLQMLLGLVARLEDPAVDGGEGLVGVLDVVDGTVDGTADKAGPAALAADRPPAILADSQAMDVRAKSEPWRRGYFEALLAAAAAAEHVDGWVVDRTRNTVFPPDVVVGPSNPHPRPLPPGASGAPREQDCEPCFPAPAELYLKLLHTQGLTPRQQITAALAFANYLEYRRDPAAAAYLYERAVLVARGGSAAAVDRRCSFFAPAAGHEADEAHAHDAAAWIRAWTAPTTAPAADTTGAVPVSQNLLTTLTAYAAFQARTGRVAEALPLFVSLLQTRRALSSADTTWTPANGGSGASSAAVAAVDADADAGIVAKITALLSPPRYPPPPDDGFGPPPPGPRARCDEAVLCLHIGEILFATARPQGPSSSSWLAPSAARQQQAARDEGIAWTREAVDMAEEQLHALAARPSAKSDAEHKRSAGTAGAKGAQIPQTAQKAPSPPPSPGLAHLLGLGSLAPPVDGRAACRQCLVTGLDNWSTMVAQMARDEQSAAAAADGHVAPARTGTSSWSSWLRLWGDGHDGSAASAADTAATHADRWAAEQRVLEDRRRRARELLDETAGAPLAPGIMSLFSV